MKDKTSAALLAFFLGGFGAHKFYLGQAGAGVVYLVFCWTLIPALVSFIEFILLLTMATSTFDARYNSAGGRIAPTQQVVIHNYTNGMSPASDRADGGSRSPTAHHAPSISDELKKLHDLHVAGVLTKEEFVAHKQRLLG